MRQIGTLPSEVQAVRFTDYLLTQQIQSRIDRDGQNWDVWVYDENRIAQAKAALQRFLVDAQAPEFQEAARQAAELRKEQERQLKQEIQQLKRQSRRQPAWRPPQPTDLPVTLFLIMASVVITMVITLQETSFGLQTELSINRFEPAGEGYIKIPHGLPDIRNGEVWRLVTPIFIHFGFFHLFMNMWMTYQFGMILEPFLRSWRFLILVLFAAVTSNLAQYWLTGRPTFGGMSGVDFALFGFLWMKGVYEPERGIGLRQDVVYFMLGFLVLCFTGIFGAIANGAHVMGLVSGCLAAVIRPAWKAMMRRA